jgi:tetratricopeptide (TPR) repeat protein
MIAVSLSVSLANNQSQAEFDHANQLYEQEDYAAAIVAYRALLERDQASPALRFNLGNAYLQAGQTGQAIVQYRLARQLNPRDPDILTNLRFARDKVGHYRESRLVGRLLHALTLNEATVLAASVLWLWCMAVTVGQARRQWRKLLRPHVLVLSILCVAGLAWFGLVLLHRLGEAQAVVITREAVCRYGPFEESQSFFTLPDGAEVSIVDRKGDWVQVKDSSKRLGWLENHQVTLVPPG